MRRHLVNILAILGFVGAMALLSAALSGCGSDDSRTSSVQTTQADIALNDGRTVTCVLSDVYGGWDISCDWATARRIDR